MNDVTAAKALGVVSVALGLTELLAAEWLQEQIGLSGHNRLVQSLGARELAAGAPLLTQTSDTALTAGLWSRVAGDAVDLALLALAVPRTTKPKALAAFTATVVGITALDLFYALRFQTRRGPIAEQVSGIKQTIADRLHALSA